MDDTEKKLDQRIDLAMVQKTYALRMRQLSMREIALILGKDLRQVHRYVKYARKLYDSGVDTSPQLKTRQR